MIPRHCMRGKHCEVLVCIRALGIVHMSFLILIITPRCERRNLIDSIPWAVTICVRSQVCNRRLQMTRIPKWGCSRFFRENGRGELYWHPVWIRLWCLACVLDVEMRKIAKTIHTPTCAAIFSHSCSGETQVPRLSVSVMTRDSLGALLLSLDEFFFL